MSTARRAQSGQTLVMFAVVLMLMLVFLLGLVVNLGAVLDQYDQAAVAASLGAQAGASAVDTNAYYDHQARQLVKDRAQQQCETAANQTPGLQVTCDVSGDHIAVTVRKNVPLPLALFGPSVPISVTRGANGVFGGRRPEPAPS